MCKKDVIESRVNSLLKEMTLTEKIGQLYQVGPSPVGGFEISVEEAERMLNDGKITLQAYELIVSNSALDGREDMIRSGMIGSFIGINNRKKANHLQRIAIEESRLGIPLIFSMDVIHGHRTIFPIPLGESCSWDDALFEKSAEISAAEAAEDGINWTLGPMIDVVRDPRWGRVAESAGEDPFLTSRFAAAKVRGFQGSDISDSRRICACAKHFAAYGAAEGGRDYNTTDMSLQRLYEVYLPPFRAAAKAGIATFMTAFNDLNGVPCTTNRFLLKKVLREEFGFDGMVISDAHGIAECIVHGTAESPEDATAQALKAGIDMDMGSEYYTQYLESLLASHEITLDEIDNAVKNVLRIKFKAGLFDHPYCEEPLKSCILSQEHRDAALESALHSMVLLKNDGILPLKKNQRIAAVGKFINSQYDMFGTAGLISGREEDAVTLLEALNSRNIPVVHAACITEKEYLLNRKELTKVLEQADIVIAAVGEGTAESGEANSVSDITLRGEQTEMLRRIKNAGKKLITVVFGGRPFALTEETALSDALLIAWHPGIEGGNAVADILYGAYNPSGRLTMTFPQAAGVCPLYYNHVPTGRPASESNWTSKYRDCATLPLFPFGFGLSYTNYVYSGLQANFSEDRLIVKVKVKNTGKVAGEETVQVYVHRRHAECTRPVKELKGWQKVYLKPGESKSVTVEIMKDDFAYYGNDMRLINDESTYDVWAAHDSSCGLHTEIQF